MLDGGNDNTSTEVDENEFMNSLALFYLQMQAKMLLPASVIQKLIEEFQEVHSSMFYEEVMMTHFKEAEDALLLLADVSYHYWSSITLIVKSSFLL